MRKAIFGFIAVTMFSTVCLANQPTFENDTELKNEITTEKAVINTEKNSDEEDAVCTAECSVTFADGTTVSASAGNIFSSCERAMRRCFEKMNDQIAED
jgi:hypothetical protein